MGRSDRSDTLTLSPSLFSLSRICMPCRGILPSSLYRSFVSFASGVLPSSAAWLSLAYLTISRSKVRPQLKNRLGMNSVA